MDHTTLFLVVSFLLTCAHVFFGQLRHRKSANHRRLPPGPYPVPIIGSIFKLGDKPHCSLAALSKTYGPLMSVKLGSKTTIVVSSPQIAKDFLYTNDLSFCSRSIPETISMVDHYKFSVAWLSVGDQWRKLRKISKEHLFSVQQLDLSQSLRSKKVEELLDHVERCCVNGKAVNVEGVAFTTTLNVLSNFIFSIDLAYYDSISSNEFKDAVSNLMETVGKPNLSDFFPAVKPLDPQGLLRKANVYSEKLMVIFDSIINERLHARARVSDDACVSRNDVLDLLLNLYQKDESEVGLNDIRHLFLDLFAAGTDTTSSTLEWAMAELIRNPEKMRKARAELMEVVGNVNRTVQEQDIYRLPYLQAIVKETFRLYPSIPFLLPRKAIGDVEIQGFIVPKDAQILCNVWATGRDLSVWSNPDRFEPERFLDSKIDYKGQDFELIPFGAGRRICPGLPLAHRMLHLMLGSLIYRFDWKLDGEMKAEDMDMSDKLGISLHKGVPLMAIPVRV